MITIAKIGICAVVAYIVVSTLCKLIFVRALKCTRCGMIVPEDEVRAHDYKFHGKV